MSLACAGLRNGDYDWEGRELQDTSKRTAPNSPFR
jgi:hypothetical protein